jgi:pimeloyl-ACP methyl ester carboxylesterase
VTLCHSVEQAHHAIAAEQFDLYVLDVMLPPGGADEIRMRGGFASGIELARRIRAKGVRAPILFFTAIRHHEFIKEYCDADDAGTFVVRKEHFEDFPEIVENALRLRTTAVKSIVFIHGLGGSARATWGLFPQLIAEDSDLADIRVHQFEYPTSILQLRFWRKTPRIQTLADGLRTYLHHVVQGRQIALVCHSLGGVIARNYLLDEIKSRRSLNVSKLLLFAVPNNGAALSRVARKVSWWNTQLRQLGDDSDLIDVLNQDWQRFNVGERVDTRFVVAALDNVVDEASARMVWGNRVDVVIDRNHRSVVKATSADDLPMRILKRLILPTS